MIIQRLDTPYAPLALATYSTALAFYTITYMVEILLPIYMEGTGESLMTIGIVMGLTKFATMVFRPLAGRATDRWGPRRVFFWALVVYPLAVGGFFIPSAFTFGLSRALMGVASAYFSTAVAVLTIYLVTDRVRGRSMSLYALATMVPATYGPAIALYVVDLVAVEVILFGFVLLSMSNVLLGYGVFRPTAPYERQAQQSRDTPDATGHAPRSGKLFFASACIAMLLTSISNGTIFTFLPLFLLNEGGRTASDVSLYFLVQTVTLVGFRALLSRADEKSFRQPRFLVASLSMASAVASALIASSVSSPGTVTLLIAAFLNGIAFSSLYPILSTFVSFHVPKVALGFWLSIYIGAADFGFALGGFAMGPIAQHVSFTAVFVTSAVVSLLAGVGFFAVTSASQSRAADAAS